MLLLFNDTTAPTIPEQQRKTTIRNRSTIAIGVTNRFTIAFTIAIGVANRFTIAFTIAIGVANRSTIAFTIAIGVAVALAYR